MNDNIIFALKLLTALYAQGMINSTTYYNTLSKYG